MALNTSTHTITLLVAKPGSGTKQPTLYFPDNEDLNKFNFALAKVAGTYDHTDSLWHIVLVDCSSYYS